MEGGLLVCETVFVGDYEAPGVSVCLTTLLNHSVQAGLLSSYSWTSSLFNALLSTLLQIINCEALNADNVQET